MLRPQRAHGAASTIRAPRASACALRSHAASKVSSPRSAALKSKLRKFRLAMPPLSSPAEAKPTTRAGAALAALVPSSARLGEIDRKIAGIPHWESLAMRGILVRRACK
jgi:hypothetical protein